jgi:hypothetical protein
MVSILQRASSKQFIRRLLVIAPVQIRSVSVTQGSGSESLLWPCEQLVRPFAGALPDDHAGGIGSVQYDTADPGCVCKHGGPGGDEAMVVNDKYDSLVAELQAQGITVTIHSASNETWYIKGDGIYQGYVVSGLEMMELKRKDRLHMKGIKSLG